MNYEKETDKREKQETPPATNSTKAGKISITSIGSEMLLDLVVALTLSWVVYRFAENSNWAWLTGAIVMVASLVKQGLKHFLQLIKPIYQNSSPWLQMLCKTLPLGGLVLVSLLKLCGPVLGLFGATVFTVTLTTIFWLNRTDVPRF